MPNVANSASASCSASAPPTASSSQPPKEPKVPIHIKAHLFFDGTKNNLHNTAERLRGTTNPPWWDFSTRRHESLFEEGSDSSYANDFTNVALLFNNGPPEKDEDSEKEFSIYVEGIGTAEGESDSLTGYAFGSGDTGIITRVAGAMDDLVSSIESLCWDKERPLFIEVSAFGFSRGAAAARHFVYHVLTGDEKWNLQRRLTELHNYLVAPDPVVKFAGLFDTVSSHHVGFSVSPDFSNDVAELHLDEVKLAEKTVHLVAADEHRETFSLTDITASRGKGTGLELFLPGVHSDIGGSYTDFANEEDACVFALPYNPNSVSNTAGMGGNMLTPLAVEQMKKEREAIDARLDKEIAWLIEQGWCDEEVHDSDVAESKNTVRKSGHSLLVNRYALRNTYSRIPLHMMAEHGQFFVKFKGTLKTENPISGTLKEFEGQVRGSPTSQPRIQNGVATPEWLRTLRRRFFHMSANYASSAVVLTPMAPNYCVPPATYGTKWNHIMNGERRRRIYQG